MLLTLYRAATGLAGPVLLPLWLRRRAARGKEDPARLGERYGIASLPRPAGRLLWFHAASVGETLSLLPLIDILAGESRILLTTGTLTSASLAAARLPAGAIHQFVPLDVTKWVKRFLDHWHPDAAIFVESEIWPVMLTELDRRNMPRLLVNARLSERASHRWQRAPAAARALFGGFAAIAAQSGADAARLQGFSTRKVRDGGNLKFSAAQLPVDEMALAAARAAMPGPVWLAASTHEGEESLIAAAHEALLADFPALITIIAPRHPGRGADLAAALGAPPRRSLHQPPQPGRLYLADTLGELGLFFRLAPFAFIGNSLVGFGGHNIIEPARLARAVLTGPHLENFADAAALLAPSGGLLVVENTAALTEAVRCWLANPQAALQAGQAAAAALAPADALPRQLVNTILELVA
jgi:3-deoxy-D-manno-octulosonic-acid transferase